MTSVFEKPHRVDLLCEHRGFTLIEMMVVIAILAVVTTIAAPNLRTLVVAMNARSAAFDLINDLAMARSEAIKRNQTVNVLPNAADWSKGWQVVTAVDGVVIREHEALANSLIVSGADTGGVGFLPNGRMSADSSPDNLEWSISSTLPGVSPRCIVITPTGAARSKSGGC